MVWVTYSWGGSLITSGDQRSAPGSGGVCVWVEEIVLCSLGSTRDLSYLVEKVVYFRGKVGQEVGEGRKRADGRDPRDRIVEIPLIVVSLGNYFGILRSNPRKNSRGVSGKF